MAEMGTLALGISVGNFITLMLYRFELNRIWRCIHTLQDMADKEGLNRG